jgi:methanogenic corrinoid protein MtbC1
VEKLKLLNRLTHDGHPIGRIASLGIGELARIADKHRPIHHPLTSQAIEGLRDFDIDRISEILEKAKLGLDTRSFILDFASPLMAEVGQRVETKEISIAQEHLLSSLLRSHFGSLLKLSYAVKPEKWLLFTTPEGDFHEFGILLCAALCLSHRIGVHYLGPNLPADELAGAVSRLQPTAIVIGTTLLPKELRKINLGEYFDQIVEDTSPKIPIFVGGDGYHPKKASKRITYVPSLQAFDRTVAGL